MHELAVTESLLDIAVRHATQAGATRVTDLYIVLGQLSSIVDDSVQFYWELVSEGTLCAGARLHFDRVPATLACDDCGASYALGSALTPCPQCGGTRVHVTGGEEFRLDSIGVERDTRTEERPA